MANKVVYMNGTAFYPSTIERSVVKKGVRQEMANGTARFFYRATKNTFVLSWTNLPESYLTNIRNIVALNAPFTYISEFGIGYTVSVMEDEYTEELDAANIGVNGTFYYNVSLTLTEH